MMKVVQRRNKLVKYLKEIKYPVTVDYLSNYLEVSIRTLYSDINALIEDGYQIEKKPGTGIWLINQEASKMGKDTNRTLEILWLLCNQTKPVTILYLAKQYYVSETSIVNSLNEIRETLLNSETAKLESDNTGTRLIGSEWEMQRTLILFHDLILKNHPVTTTEEFYDSFIPYYTVEDIYLIKSFIDTFSQYGLSVPALYYERKLFQVLLVLLSRLKKGKHIQVDKSICDSDRLLNLTHYFIAKDLLSRISTKVFITFCEEDIYYLSVNLKANQVYFIASKFEMNNIIVECSKSMIAVMSDAVGIDLRDNEQLFQNLLKHLTSVFLRQKVSIVIYNEMLDKIKKEFRLMYELTWMVVEKHKSYFAHELSDDEVGFIMIHFQATIDASTKVLKVLVVCPNGVVMSNFLINRIHKYMPGLDFLQATSLQEVKQMNLDNIDCILSTVPLELNSVKTIQIPNLASDEEIRKVVQELSTPIYKDNSGHFQLTNLKPYISKKYITSVIKIESVSSYIKQVLDGLYQDGIVEKEYLQSVLQREKIASTSNGFFAALPHGNIDYVKKTTLYFTTLKQSVKWGKYQVKLIVFICICKKDLPKAKGILQEIYSLIQNKDVLENFIHSSEELRYQILSGETKI